jgi:hypothetical protein
MDRGRHPDGAFVYGTPVTFSAVKFIKVQTGFFRYVGAWSWNEEFTAKSKKFKEERGI